MQVVGITGTNGKTTTAYLIASIFDAAELRCGLLGTVGYRIGDEVRDATHTTPEAPEVQALLREMVDRGCGACAMEVSSHALSLRRVDGMTFAAGGVHQSDPRSPRLPRRHGGVLPGQAAAVRAAAARRAEPHQPRRSARRRAHRRRRPAGDLRDQPAGRHHAGPAVVLARGSDVRRAHAARHASASARRWSAVRTSTTSSRRSATATALGHVVRRDRAGRRGARRRARPIRDRVRRRRTRSPSSSTTRTPTMRCATCSRRRARSRAGG